MFYIKTIEKLWYTIAVYDYNYYVTSGRLRTSSAQFTACSFSTRTALPVCSRGFSFLGTMNYHPCCVVGCEPSDWRRVRLRHRVPLQGSRRAEWLRRIGLPVRDRRADLRVCGRHFRPQDYCHNVGLMREFGCELKKHPLKDDALPWLFLPGAAKVSSQSIQL